VAVRSDLRRLHKDSKSSWAPVVAHEPFPGTRSLGGFYLIQVEDLDRLDIAAVIPSTRVNGTIEERPIVERTPGLDWSSRVGASLAGEGAGARSVRQVKAPTSREGDAEASRIGHAAHSVWGLPAGGTTRSSR
jgi:hypothetical protein